MGLRSFATDWSKGHIPSLDGFRAISVIIVFFSHAGYGHIFPGLFGVTVFFFISGFLITTLLCREHDKSSRIDVFAFFARRFIRIIPPLIIAVIIAIAFFKFGLISGYLDGETVASQLLFVANYHEIYGEHLPLAGLDVLWSLAVEEHFYLIWPFIFPIIYLAKKNIIIGITVILAFLLWRCVHFYVFNSSEMHIAHASDTRFDSLLIGCVAALVFRNIPQAAINVSQRTIYLISILAVMTLMLTFVIRSPEFRSIYRYSIQSLALIPIFFFAINFPNHTLYRILNNAILMKIGVFSYSIYLIHSVILDALDHTFGDRTGAINIAVAFLISVGFSYLVFRFVDLPLLALRKKYR